ncbi:MAG: DNA ligase D, partial [Burkholderiales bacterium]
GDTIAQISADPRRAWTGGKSRKLKGAASTGRRAPLPQKLKPQLATLVKEVPTGDHWVHEIKYDGYRILCRVTDGKVRLFSRNGLDWTRRFQAVADAAKKLPVKNGWFDGEVVVQKPDGSTSFQALQNALTEGNEVELAYYLFDVPYCNGQDLRASPLIERKRLLAKLVDGKGPIRYSDHVQGKGEVFFTQACTHELEGIVSKQRDSKYHGARTRDWVKVKCGRRQEFVIGGYTDPSGSRKGLGALLLGVHDETGLRYAGKVGTGFNERSLTELKSRLEKIEQRSSPFSNVPRERGVHWVKPELIAEVAFTEWTDDHLIRHSSFQGLREDKSAKEIEEEKPATKMEEKKPHAGNEKLKLTNPDKVLYQEQGLTKRDLALYYEAVADLILPHVKDRPLTLVRCPNGPKGKCFYQKNINETVPEAIESVPIPDEDGTSQYMMANSPAALIGLVQMGVLEIHPWGATADNLDRPDRMFFDLDPDVGLG